jgi:hypothetical protein
MDSFNSLIRAPRCVTRSEDPSAAPRVPHSVTSLHAWRIGPDLKPRSGYSPQLGPRCSTLLDR